MAPWTRAKSDGQEDDLLSQQQDQDTSRLEPDEPRLTTDQHNNGTQSAITDQDLDEDLVAPGEAKPVYTSQLATLLIIVNVTIGTGLLAMPYAMQTAGLVPSMIVQFVFLILTVITCIMCIELTVKSNVKSYHEIVQKHCHPLIYQLTQVTIFLLVFATTVAYIVIIGDQSDRVFNTLYGQHFCNTWYLHRRFIMVMTTLIVIKPLCSARTVDFLKYASFLGVLTIGFIFYVVVQSFAKLGKVSPTVNTWGKSWGELETILPVFCLAYQCHLSLVPTVATIRRKEKPKAFITSSIAMIIAMIVYSAISLLAVFTFGSDIKEDLTGNFEGKNIIPLLTVAIVGLKCALTLPAAYLPARLSIIDILTQSWPRFASFSERVQRVGVTLAFLDLALMFAIVVPDILTVVNLIGSLAVMFIFSLPGLAYISLVKQNRIEKQVAAGLDPRDPPRYTARDYMKLYASHFMIVFGIIMTGVVLYRSVAELMVSVPSSPLCVVENY